LSKAPTITPSSKPIKAYYQSLRDLAAQEVEHESAVRSAFQTLLAELARAQKWTAIPELGKKIRGIKGRQRIIPDGTIRDKYQLPRAYWEAKDTADDLDREIIDKIKLGYPTNNAIFWTPTYAVVFQNGERRHESAIDEAHADQLCDLLTALFTYVDKPIIDFDDAVEKFTERVPQVGRGLAEIIAKAHKDVPKFKAAFTAFFDLCRTTLNPNISQQAVDEMLVQHLLTERLFKTVFNNPEFTRKNVIAAEVEKVIDALTSRAFNREEFLSSLDLFYVAIENAAASVKDWSSKQHFLNTVYERFFQGYCVKTADTHGIVYTPQPIVDFMCASVEWVLKEEFGKALGDDGVNILDPCTGTGNFVVNLMRRAADRGKKHLERMYRKQLFANEIMLMPYYIAALNIEHEHFEQTGEYEAFEGLCFVDTLELAEPKHTGLFTEANLARVERQKKTPIEIIIGNPPYNVGQMTHNEQNQNRPYPTVDHWIKHSYAADSQATSVSKLNDPYVKFFRWATRRLEDRDGIVCFVTNNSFVDNIAYDGMRKHLARDFQAIYHLDLEGNVRQNPALSGTQYNVFGIQVGVGITVCVKRQATHKRGLFYANVRKDLRREDKLQWLTRQESIGHVKWQKLKPDAKSTWLVAANGHEFAECIPIASRATRSQENGVTGVVFKDYSLGIATHRDSVVYDFSKDTLVSRVKAFVDSYNTEVDRWKRAPKDTDVNTFVSYESIAWDRDLKKDLLRGRYAEYSRDGLREVSYRPFSKQWLYFDRLLNAEIYGFPSIAPTASAHAENRLICCSDVAHRSERFSAVVLNGIADLHLCATLDGHQCFPFFQYDEDGSHRRENITDWALDLFRRHYGAVAKKRTKWDIFHYVYAILHHPGYRETFADNLKRELPRIPLAKTYDDFRAFVAAGEKLAKLHLNYDDEKTVKPFALKEVWTLKDEEGKPRRKSWRVDDKMRLSKEKDSLKVNDSLTLTGIPEAVYRYRLGNRSALEWVIDQYQVSTDKRTGIVSDCNAWGEERNDEEYIVRLVKQVVTVSIETMKIIDDLPKDYGGPPTVPLDSPGMARASFDLASSGSKATKSGTHPLKLRSDTPTRQRKLRDK
jgi:predicted helicase